MKSFEAAFASWIVRNPWIVIALSILLIAIPATGLSKLYFDSSYRVYFSNDNPELSNLETIEATYNESHNVIIVVAPKDGNVFTARTLSAIEQLTEDAWQVPFSRRVDSITNFQYTTAEEDDLVVRDMVKNGSAYSAAKLLAVREAVLAEPALVNRLVSKEGHVTGVNITLSMPVEGRTEAEPQIVAYARKIAAKLDAQYPELETYLSGVVMLNNTFGESAANDFTKLVPISFALMMIIVAILIGGVAGTLVTMVIIIASVIAAMGAAGHIGFPLTGMSASAPIIILTVAVANCVHVLVSFVHGLRKGETKAEAMDESLRINLQPVFLASATTAIGFTSMNFSVVPPFQYLGNIVCMGVLFSFVLTVTFLPAVMSLLPTRRKPADEHTQDGKLMTRLADFVIAKQRALLWSTLIVFGALIANIPRNEINDVFVHYFDETIPFRVATDFMVENMTGVYLNDYSLESGETGGISNPAFLRDVEKLSEWLETQPGTVHVDRFTTIMKRLNKNMHGDEDGHYTLPDDRRLAAQYLLLYEMSLPYGLDINNQINVDKSATKLAHTIGLISSKAALGLDKSVHKWVKDNAPSIKRVISGSPTLMFSNIGQRNSRTMLLGTSAALAAISVILVVALRSFKIGMVSLIPNLVPAAVGFGLWGIFVGEVGMTLSVVTGMSFGIVVDNTVHFLSKYLRARRESGLSPEAAIRYAFRTVGNALVITTSTLIVGFLTLATSSFSLNADMGMLTAVVIAVALVAVFLLLPPLLLKIDDPGDGSAPGGERLEASAPA
ncbi:MAG: putative RND superfamily exporter protein [Gammaproteobacteria bacterium]|jgi:predicted RND superfamily exporter protein